MRIPTACATPSEPNPIASTSAVDGATPAKAVGHAHTDVSPSVKVTVSAQARELASLGGEGFDAAKVAKLKTSIANGTWKVDSAKVGARIAEDGG